MVTLHNAHEATGSRTAMAGSAATASSAYDTTHHDDGNPVVKKALIALVIILVIGGYAAYEILVNDKSPDEIVAPLLSQGQEVIALFWDTADQGAAIPPPGGQEVVAVPPTPEVAPAPETAVPPAPEADIQADIQADVSSIDELPADAAERSVERPRDSPSYLASNPYLELPNPAPRDKIQFARAWSVQEEEVWRSGLTHQFVWQQYKTVQDVVSLRLAGSDAILWEALNNPRLWIRMKAVVGLVKLGMNVGDNAVLQALGEERPSLLANYFKRFTVKNDAAERFVMRYALHTVGPRARRHIIQALVVGRDELSGLYLVAATLDKDRRVSGWAQAELQRRSLPPGEVEEYRSQVTSSSF